MSAEPVYEAQIILHVDRRHPQEARLADRIRYEQSRTVQARLAGMPTAQGLREVVDEARRLGEEVTSRHRDPAGPQVACNAGCSACCHQPVRVLAPEAFAIAHYVNHELAEADRARVLECVRERDVAMRDIPLRTRLERPLACVFLDGLGRCSIYSARPLACAGFSSYDVQECKRSHASGFKPGGVLQERARMLAFYAVQHGLADGLAASLPSADVAWLEMIHAVTNVLAWPNAESAWMRGEPVFAQSRLDDSGA